MFSAELNASRLTYKHVCDQPRKAFSIWNVRSWLNITVTLRNNGAMVWTGPAFAGLAVERDYTEAEFTVKLAPTAGHRYFIDFSDTGVVPPPLDTTEQSITGFDNTDFLTDVDIAAVAPATMDLTGALQPSNSQHLWLLPTRAIVTYRRQSTTNVTDRTDSTIPWVNNAAGSGAAQTGDSCWLALLQPNIVRSVANDPFNWAALAQSLESYGASSMKGFNYWDGAANQHVQEFCHDMQGYFTALRHKGFEARTTEVSVTHKKTVYILGRLCRDLPWRRP